MPIRVDARRSAGMGTGASELACAAGAGVEGVESEGGGSGASGDFAIGGGVAGTVEGAACCCDDWPAPSVGPAPVAPSRRSRPSPADGSDGLAIAADAVPCGEAGASAGANGPADWLQEAAARPSAAQMSGRNILIMGAL
jgi:hypothetical protein